MVAAAELLKRCVRAALLPRTRDEIDGWCDRFVRLPEKGNPEPGPWRTDRTPYLRRPMRLFALEGAPASITLMTGSQVGKTAATDGCKLWSVCQRPGPSLVMMGNLDEAREYNEDRFLPLVQACPPAAAELLPSPQETKKQKINFRRMVMWFVGSNAKGGRRHRSVKYLFCDEVETYESADWVEVLERDKAWSESKKLFTSTPQDEGGEIHRLFLEGSRERFWVPCPHGGCGAFQVLVFPRLKWDGGGRSELALASARYECRRCQGKIYNHHKPALLRRGVWVSEEEAGGRLVMSEAEAREADAEGKPPPEHASFQLSSLYSPFEKASLGRMAEAFVKGGGQVTPSFVRGWIGEPWQLQGDRVEEKELLALCAPVADGGYRLKTVPRQALGLVLTADIQKTEIYVEVRAWGERGRDTWLVDAYTLARREGMDLAELDAAPRVYRVGSLEGGDVRTMRVTAEGVDSGHFTCEVYEYIRRRKSSGLRNVWAMKGADGAAIRQPYLVSHIDVFPEGSGSRWAGKPIPGGVDLLVFSNDVWKTRATGRMKGRPEAGLEGGLEGGEGGEEDSEETGGTHGGVPQGVPGLLPGFYLPDNSEKQISEYIRQLTSEHKVRLVDKRTGRPPVKGALTQWQRRPGMENHWFDCCVMNFALADKLGVRGAVAGTATRKTAAAKGEAAKGSGWVSGARHE